MGYRHHKKTIFFRMMLFISCLHFQTITAQNYSVGYKEYSLGNFEKAENAFQLALNKSVSQAEKSRIYKMLGISQYMQGKRAAAEASFQQAKQLNPYVTISSSEVPDQSVISFFNRIKAPLPQGDIDVTQKTSKSTNEETTLSIYANIAGASVSVDGVRLGSPGRPLSVNPGIHKVMVSARGYESVVQTINIRENVANNLSVHLKKNIIKSEDKTLKSVDNQVEKQEKGSDDLTKKSKDHLKKEQIASASPKKTDRKEQRKQTRKKNPAYDTPDKPDPLMYLLPFGAGQYLNGENMKGAFFSLIQAGSLIYGISQYLASEALLTETNDEIKRLDQERSLIQDLDEWDAHRQKTQIYQQDQQNKLDTLYVQQLISFSVFGISWAGSSLDAFIFSEFSSDIATTELTPDRYSTVISSSETQKIPKSYKFSLHPFPLPHHVKNSPLLPGLAFTLRLELKF
ncbi:MAG: PEGA domain-containing protein [Deltaproteobacteria bacterium]|nr:PEGA domain-containing protein [Deltaproteobacteria bacterium]